MFFQDPMNSLNPVLKIEKQFAEIFKVHFKNKNSKKQNSLAVEYLNKVKINNPEKVLKMYPHELSGGMKQRIVIAMVLACEPDIILADEPTTAIDATVQSEILKLLLELQKELSLTIIFVTHDMGIVSQISDRIAVMYAGKIIELGSRNEVIKSPAHPYTRALLAALPSDSDKPLEVIPGTPPNLALPIKGDAFAPRNKFALEIDFEKEPPMIELSPTHQAASWILDPAAKEAKKVYDEYYTKLGVING
jgi:oligopeptide transport system ATP-binding protein